MIRLDLALVTAQRNQDIEGEDLVKNTIAALSAQGEFKDIQSLGQESDQLKSFDFGLYRSLYDILSKISSKPLL